MMNIGLKKGLTFIQKKTRKVNTLSTFLEEITYDYILFVLIKVNRIHFELLSNTKISFVNLFKL